MSYCQIKSIHLKIPSGSEKPFTLRLIKHDRPVVEIINFETP